MDKFVVKLRVSSTEKKSSHLPVNIINCKCYKYMESFTGKSERTKNTICLLVYCTSLFYSNLQVCIYVNAKLLFLYVLIVV